MTKAVDIIHPNSHARDDSAYFESYAATKVKRRKLTDTAQRPVTKRPLANGGYIDDDFIRRFKHHYAMGMTRKGLSINMECGTNTVGRLIRELKLERRTKRGTGEKPGKTVDFHLVMAATLAERLEKRCAMGWRRKTEYIIRLIEADLAKNGL